MDTDTRNVLVTLGNQFKILCVCGSEMHIKQSSSENNLDGTYCDECKVGNHTLTYHCTQKENKFHKFEYNYCIKCGVTQYLMQKIENQNKQKQPIENDTKEENINLKLQQKQLFEQRLKLIDFNALQNRYKTQNIKMANDTQKK
eukprot:28507_1